MKYPPGSIVTYADSNLPERLRFGCVASKEEEETKINKLKVELDKVVWARWYDTLDEAMNPNPTTKIRWVSEDSTSLIMGPGNMCASCDNDCPRSDYLCEPCRTKLFPACS